MLAVEDSKALLITENLVDRKPYNETFVDVTWENCTLRSWLNNDFLNEAFSSEEQSKIATVTNTNPNNPEYGTWGGNDTQDKIFALSIDEAIKYFEAIRYFSGEPQTRGIVWWLRSPGYRSDYAAYVYTGGGVFIGGYRVNLDRIAIRPAMWVHIGK